MEKTTINKPMIGDKRKSGSACDFIVNLVDYDMCNLYVDNRFIMS